MQKKKVKIVYSPELEVEKKENFVSTKLGSEVSDVKKIFEKLPSSVKWLLAVLIGGFISALVEMIILMYFELGFTGIEDISNAFKIQFIIDAILTTMIIIFIGLLVKEARS